MDAGAPQQQRELTVEIPRKLEMLLKMHRYKVVYGGRGSAKSWSIADALLFLGAHQKLLILCTREIQKSIKESVHRLLCSRIEALGLGEFYDIYETTIKGRNGTEFIYSGLHGHTVESIKSFEGVDVVWVEEAQTVSEVSWRILLPTIRADNSEIWVSFNPDMETDAVWQRFMVKRPTNCVVVKMNYTDNPWFPKELEQERLDCKRDYPDDYANVWLGENRVTVAGAIYAKEVQRMVEDRRFIPLPYDPRLPVHTVWDLGWNDKMTIIMVQKPHPSALNVINYREDNQRRYDEYVGDMRHLGYNWGTHYLPHDGAAKNPQTGASAVQILRKLGLKRIRIMPRTDPEERIKAARMMFPRIYMDNSERDVRALPGAAGGFLGCHRLMECLKRYRRAIPKTTEEPASPVHDEYSHGCDAFGGLGEVVDQIRNEGDVEQVVLPGFSNHDSSMGTLG